MFNIGPWELILILAVALVVLGPGKLPEVGKSLGRGLKEFKKATNDIQKDLTDVLKDDEPTTKK